MQRSWRGSTTIALAMVVAVSGARAFAQAEVEKGERCATRLSIALLGRSPAPALLSLAAPQSDVDRMLETTEFQQNFARFINAKFNDDPGATAADDSAYFLARVVLRDKLRWEEMFLGQYRVVATAQAPANTTALYTESNVGVYPDTEGLGFFRSRPWLERYAGNEEEGIRIATAYRMMHNTIGLKLVASTNSPDADVSATGRQGPGCATCHFNSWFALDKTAEVLGRVRRNNNTVSFTPYTGPAVPLLGGIQVQNDKELVTALVKSEAFEFRACRLAFEFLYGRPEVACEGPIFDSCMDEFKAKGTIQSAIAVVAKNQAFCQ